MKNPEENLGLVMRVQVNKVDIHVPARDSHMVRTFTGCSSLTSGNKYIQYLVIFSFLFSNSFISMTPKQVTSANRGLTLLCIFLIYNAITNYHDTVTSD
jgi:hypothetical protein